MTRTIEARMIVGVPLSPDTFDNCRSHYARERGCKDPRNGKVGGKHLGHDQWAAEGTPILAPCDGTMRYISTAGDYGNWGKFQSHKTKKGIWIAHCRDRLKLDDYRKSQEIGKVGTTGTQSTGPHCHSELHPDALNFNSVENIYPELLAASQPKPKEEDLNEAETRKVAREEFLALLKDGNPITGVARMIVLNPTDPTQGYKLDLWGAIHQIGDVPPLVGPDLKHCACALGLVITRWGPSPQGYVLDSWGACHPVGGAPSLKDKGHWGSGTIAEGD